jgi:hypothetical protein
VALFDAFYAKLTVGIHNSAIDMPLQMRGNAACFRKRVSREVISEFLKDCCRCNAASLRSDFGIELTNGFHKLLEMKRRPLNPSSTETQESRPRRYNVAIGCELRK